jgi:hypothetical protein
VPVARAARLAPVIFGPQAGGVASPRGIAAALDTAARGKQCRCRAPTWASCQDAKDDALEGG